jgi:hypothetical protein
MSTVKELREQADEAISALYEACERDVEKLEDKVADLEEKLQDAKSTNELAPKWGDCLRGCPPSYLDHNQFCSPACALGAPRGEFVTAAA